MPRKGRADTQTRYASAHSFPALPDVIDKVFVSDSDGQQILTYWQHLARTISVSEKFKAKTLTGKLMATPMTNNAELSAQIKMLTSEIATMDNEIVSRELELNEVIYSLYELSPEERKVIGTC